jgi:hypothetical protein
MNRNFFKCILLAVSTTLLLVSLMSCGGGDNASSFSISGTVSSNSVKQGVTITLSGGRTGTATTDSNGSYSFGNLSNGSYTVTPSMTGYTFSPASQSVTLSGANATASTFVAIDSTAPAILSSNPVNGAKKVSVITNLQAVASEALDAATISTSTVTLTFIYLLIAWGLLGLMVLRYGLMIR